uniref:hypothetical protein n=1 Tax=Ndongobacter massiliensis TaxID=1871025 RepID=UPI000930402F|nr:hypothetical protein [Ndongobacter massiliensis]
MTKRIVTEKQAKQAAARLERVRAQHTKLEFKTRAEEITWVKEQMQALEHVKKSLQTSVSDVDHLTETIGTEKLSPGRLGKLSDVGKSWQGVRTAARQLRTVKQVLSAIEKHPLFAESAQEAVEALTVEPLTSPQARFSRVQTQWKLRRQSATLQKSTVKVQALLRTLGRRLRQLEQQEKQAAWNEKLDALQESLQNLEKKADKR